MCGMQIRRGCKRAKGMDGSSKGRKRTQMKFRVRERKEMCHVPVTLALGK